MQQWQGDARGGGWGWAGAWGRRTSQVHVRGSPGGKLGMPCCWLSSSPLGSTAVPQSHNYPLLRQAYALTASETPHLSPTFCLLHCSPLQCCTAHTLSLSLWPRRRGSTQQNLTLLTASSPILIRSLSTLSPPLSLSLSPAAKVLHCSTAS